MIDLGVGTPLSSIGLVAGLVDLETLEVQAVTADAARLLGRPARSIIGRPASDVLDPQERSAAVAALEAMRSGSIDFYRAHRQLGPGVSERFICAWVRAIELGGRRMAFVAWLPTDVHPEARPRLLGDVVARIVSVGITDSRGVAQSASVEPDNARGIRVEDIVGLRLVEERSRRQMSSVARAERAPYGALSFAFPVRGTTRAGIPWTLVCVMTRLAGSLGSLFLLSEPTSLTRASELEQHLWRIAAEVEASGILIGYGSLPSVALESQPGADAMTPRQWEVLRRLVGGQRVPTIARELFVSQSTVRNHLSAIFVRFGVHSQAELLATLATRDTPSL